jgi:flagellar biosynthetic protein FlhB
MASDRDNNDISGAPSPRVIAHVREHGHWPRSGQLVFASAMLAAVLTIRVVGEPATQRVTTSLAEQLASSGDVRPTTASIATCRAGLLRGLIPLAGLLLVPAIVAVVVSIGQVGLRFSPQTVLPDVTRLNPVGRLAAIISAESAQRSLLALVQWLTFIVAAGWWIWREFLLEPNLFAGATGVDMAVLLVGATLRVATNLAILLFIFGCIDYALAWRAWRQQIQPSRAEQLVELKETDGDPRLRQARRQRHASTLSRRSDGGLNAGSLVVVGKGRLAVVVRSADSRVLRVHSKVLGAAADRLQQAARRANARIIRNSLIAQELFRCVPAGEVVPARLASELDITSRTKVRAELLAKPE